jgi:ubiquinone/menaquinone biosynthesis C-methylase UbiE
MTRLKTGAQIVKKQGLSYVAKRNGSLVRFSPWLSDRLSFVYDLAMSKSVLPKKLGVDIQKHYDCLGHELAGVVGKKVLEIGTGSGSVTHFLDRDNDYTGIDISPGLLKRAARRFAESGFADIELFVGSGAELPFQDSVFDLCLCILSLNFIEKVENVFKEVGRVLLAHGAFICAVPVPEKNKNQKKIRGILYSEGQLKEICQDNNFGFEPISCENGCLLYFRATR